MRKAISLTFILLVGCSSLAPRSKPWVAGDQQSAVTFCGIRHSLDTTKSARLLIIHGMGSHAFGYDDGFRNLLKERLGLRNPTCTGPQAIKDPHDPSIIIASILACKYERKIDNAQLQTFTLLWSPLTEPYKVKALQYDWSEPYAN